jgi:hypothetical protein
MSNPPAFKWEPLRNEIGKKKRFVKEDREYLQVISEVINCGDIKI